MFDSISTWNIDISDNPTLSNCAWTIEFTNSLVNKFLFSKWFDGEISPHDSGLMLIRRKNWDSTDLALATDSYLLQNRVGLKFPKNAVIIWKINSESVFLVDVSLVKLRALNILSVVKALKHN